MTLTTGPVPVTTATPVARPRERITGTIAAGRTTGIALALDALVAVTVAGAAVIHPSSGGTVRGAILLGWPLAIALAGGYSRQSSERRLPARALLGAALAALTVLWGLPTLIPAARLGASSDTVAAAALLLAALVLVGSATARWVLAMAAPSSPARTVLVGHSSQVHELMREALRPGGRSAFDPVAVCLPDAEDDLDPTPEGWPVPVTVGEIDTLLEIVRTHDAEAVVVAPGPGITHAELRRWGVLLQHEGVRLLVDPGLRDVATSRIGTAHLRGSRLLAVHPVPLSGPARVLKDVADRVAALLLLVAFAPLLGVLALMIRADSPGRAFYWQTRVGWHGKPFTVFKLRTMCADADRIRLELEDGNHSDGNGLHFKMKRDPRITRVGAFLRLTSLDELPQLINVVKGEMSLIGPRPALPSEVAAYPPDLRRRLDVKPGLTGLWQVSGRSDLSLEDTQRFDLQYVDNWSWWMDVKIALRTAGAVVSRRGAY